MSSPEQDLAAEDSPVPADYLDTTDLRAGPPISDELLALLPLVGTWSGSGRGIKPATGAEFSYFQQLTFAHDGRPFLAYQSQTWLVDADGAIDRCAARESGFWRPGAGPDDVEVVLALNTGLTLVLTGVAGDQRWELTAQSLSGAPTAKAVEDTRRFYALDGDDLVYAHELAPAGRPMQPHLNARLHRQ